MTIDAAVKKVAARLSESFSSQSSHTGENPWLESEILLSHLLGCERWMLRTRGRDELPSQTLSDFYMLAERRIKGEPISYIIGKREFWARDFQITPSTLIPRPETELIIETALEIFPENSGISILDAGTGSGILAITLALELPGSFTVASDISFAALKVAAQNVRRYRDEIALKGSSVVLVNSNWLGAFKAEHFFDLVVSNPPYVAENDTEFLAPDVVEHEPHEALFAGNGGLEDIEELIKNVPKVLKPGGWFICELGIGQGEKVLAIAESAGAFRRYFLRKDLAGIERVLIVQRF